MQACGLVHWKSVTVPCILTTWCVSNGALPWCAQTEAAPNKSPATRTAPSLRFISVHDDGRSSHRISFINRVLPWVEILDLEMTFYHRRKLFDVVNRAPVLVDPTRGGMATLQELFQIGADEIN